MKGWYVNDDWKKLEGSGRSLIEGTIPAFAWKD
jgi:hypothetical protein